MKRRCFDSLLPLAVSLLLIGCGPADDQVAEGGIAGTGVSMGRVSQIGSVYVNDIHYNTDNTRFVINGNENGDLTDIGVGMVVQVTGSKDSTTGTGVADQVVYESLLVGPVDILFEPTTHHIGIAGQTVHINDDTVIEDNLNNPALTVDQLLLNTLIEVSGYPSSPGEILATRIELKSYTDVYKVSGLVSAVASANGEFTVGGLTIDASAIAQLPAVGSFVKVEGPLPPGDGYFTAESVTPVQTSGLAGDGAEFTLEGVITTRLDPVTHLFSINGQTVDASLTPYSIDEMALAAGRMVKVDGIMDGDVLLAEEIELDTTRSARETIAFVLQNDTVDLDARTVTLMDKTVHITNSTIFENDRYGESTFSLDELQAGDFLAARVVDNNGELTATKLELDDAPYSYSASLKGYPKNLGGGQIEILGVTIDTSGISGYTFKRERTEVRGQYDLLTGILIATRIDGESDGDDDDDDDDDD